MRNRFSSLMFFSLALVAVLAMTAFGAIAPQEGALKSKLNPSLVYGFPDAQFKHLTRPGKDIETGQQALGAFVPSQSPGVVIGDTWYDYQRNGSMRRMITTGTHTGDVDTFLVHFSWMRLPSSDITIAREMRYDVFNATAGIFGQEVGLQPDDEYAGYGGVSRTPGNAAVVGCHNNLNPPEGPYHVQCYYDFGPGNSFFNTNSRIPDSTSTWEGDQSEITENGGIWPAFEYVEDGSKTGYTHVIAQESDPDAGDPQAIFYFRKVGVGAAGEWTYPPYVIDTVHDLAHDLDARDSIVALAWTANLNDPADPCNGGDTCSTSSWEGLVAANQWNNDLYVQISYNYGASFQPRMNITKNVLNAPGFRPYTNLSVLIDTRGVVHVVFDASEWAGNNSTSPSDRGRFFHWDDLTNTVVTAHNFQFDQDSCSSGAWNLTASKMSVSECRDKLYLLFTQFNNPETELNDCAAPANPGYPDGAANGDLYLCVSEDWGSTWDKARNITNSITKGCDSALGPNGPCDNDHWSSMVRFGSNYAGTFPPDAIIANSVLDDDPATNAGYYLDAQYINDKSAGGIVQNEGYWHLADVKWIRIPCVDAKRAAQLYVTPDEIDYPSWSNHGPLKLQHDTLGTIEGGGNAPASYSLTAFEDSTKPGTYAGWLGVTQGDPGGSVIPNEVDGFTIHLNVGGVVNNPGTIQALYGHIDVNWQGVGFPPGPSVITVPILHLIADTLILPVWDTIETDCTRLTVSNNGNAGDAGRDSVNLDYMALGGDCTGQNVDPDDDAEVYLYDASPFVCYVDEASNTSCYWSIFGSDIADTNVFKPLGGETVSDSAGAQRYYSGVFVTGDSNVCIEKIWYAPKNDPDTCSFVIQCIKVYGNPDDTDFVAPTSFRVGEAMDWDIPADTGSRNYADYDANLNLYYQQGSEEEAGGCADNSLRWGGISFLDCYKNGERCTTYSDVAPYGAYAHTNSTHVYPAGGFHEDTLHLYSGVSGWSAADSQNTDIHTVMTFSALNSITQADTFVYYVALATHYQGSLESFKNEVKAGIEWYCGHISPAECGCCNGDGLRGNADGITGAGGEVDVADLTYLVAYLFLGGPAPPCLDEGNVDGITGAGGPVDVADLTYLVAYLFLGGPPPASC